MIGVQFVTIYLVSWLSVMFFPGSLAINMMKFISRDENIKSTSAYIGYIILRTLKKSKYGKISIFDAVGAIKSDRGVVHYRQLLFALILLYTTHIIDFEEPYIYNISHD